MGCWYPGSFPVIAYEWLAKKCCDPSGFHSYFNHSCNVLISKKNTGWATPNSKAKSKCGPSVYSENCSFHHHMFFRFGWTSFSDSTLVWAYLCPCSHCQKDIHFLTARVTADDVCYICWWWIAVPISANFWDSIRLKERYFIKLWQVSMYVCVRVYIHLQMHVCIYVYIWILYVYMIKIVLFKRERTEADKCRMYVALSMRNP